MILRWKNTITTWHLTGMQLCYRHAHFQFIALQRAFWECQANPHWKDMSVDWSILHLKGTKSSLLPPTLREFLRDLMVSFLFILNLNLWTAALSELIYREHRSLEKEALSENTVSSNNIFLWQRIHKYSLESKCSCNNLYCWESVSQTSKSSGNFI